MLHNQKFSLPDKHVLPKAYDVVACTVCGFVYADTTAFQADYDHYYEQFSKYEDNAVSTGGGTTEWDARRLEETAADLAGFIPDRNAAILDVGCANGGLLKALRNRGYDNLLGLDPSRSCVAHVQNQGIQAVIGGLFSPCAADSPVPRERFDGIILSHVLEHVYDLQRAIRNVRQWLKTGGVLYVEVPDASHYPDYFVVPYYYFDCEHINHFDEHSLENLIVPLGWAYLASGRKELPASSVNVYPAVYAVFKKTDGYDTPAGLVSDVTVRDSVVAYVEKSHASDQYIELDEFARSQEKIIVWGAGSYTLRLLETTSLGKCNIIAYVDKDTAKQGTKLSGIVISHPQILHNFIGPVVISSALHSQEIIKELRTMGLDNDVTVL